MPAKHVTHTGILQVVNSVQAYQDRHVGQHRSSMHGIHACLLMSSSRHSIGMSLLYVRLLLLLCSNGCSASGLPLAS